MAWGGGGGGGVWLRHSRLFTISPKEPAALISDKVFKIMNKNTDFIVTKPIIFHVP